MLKVFKWLCIYSVLVFIYLGYSHYRYEEYIRGKIMQWHEMMDNMWGSQEAGVDPAAFEFIQNKNEQNSEYLSYLKGIEDLKEAERVQQKGIDALYSENQYNLAKDRFDDYIDRFYKANPSFAKYGCDISEVRKIVSSKSIEAVAKRSDELIAEGTWDERTKMFAMGMYNAFHEGVMMNEKKKTAQPIEDLIKFNLERNGNTKGKELNEKIINSFRKDPKAAIYTHSILEFLASKDPSGKSSMESILRSHDYNDLSNFIENMGSIKDYEGLKDFVKLDNNNKALKALGIDVNEFLTNIKSIAEYKSNMLKDLGDGYRYSPYSVELNIGGKDTPYMINTGILANVLSINELDRLKAIAEKDRKVANEMMGIKE